MHVIADRSDQSKRRTKTVKRTLNPMWQQTFTYSNFKRQDMKSMSLEISLWDLDRSYQTNSHFMGRVIFGLKTLSFFVNTLSFVALSIPPPYHFPQRSSLRHLRFTNDSIHKLINRVCDDSLKVWEWGKGVFLISGTFILSFYYYLSFKCLVLVI